MPPKKKVKEPEAIQQIQAEPLLHQNLLKIPKKPLYRSVNLDSDKKARRIQIKVWKVNSLQVKLQTADFRQDLSSLIAKQNKLSRAVSRLSNKQRAFKNLKRFNFDSSQLQEAKIDRLIARSWRLEKLLLDSHGSYFPVNKLVRRSLHPHLKDFFLKMNLLSQEDFQRSIDGWEPLVGCNVWFDHSLILNTKNIRSFVKFFRRSGENQVIESLQGISIDIPWKHDTLSLLPMDASQIPNLKTLQVSYKVTYQMEKPHPTLDFIKKYPQLTSLSISTQGKDVPSFEFLSSLPNLKQLSLSSCQNSSRRIPKTLPLIHTLEKLKISCYPGEFSPENLQEFFINNKNLKYLEVQFSMQDDYLIFHENLILPIETLKLTNPKMVYSPPMTIAGKKLAAFLSKNKHVKSLYLDLTNNFSLNVYESVLKGLASMACLEHLTWFCGVPNELQESKLKDLKKALIQCSGIQKLELDFGQGFLTSKDFSNILDGLWHLKKLKYLSLRGNFLKITPATFNKFFQFLRSLILENAATVVVHLPGIPLEIAQEIDRIIAKKSDLW